MDLLDAWSWGGVELARRLNTEGRPTIDILADMFAEIEKSSVELVERLTLACEGLSDE
jgi:hypothetical protein